MGNYTPGSYDRDQQIYCLSFISNAAGGVAGYPTIADLQTYVNTVIQTTLGDSKCQKYIGSDWKTVWGPSVVSHIGNPNPVVADNSMMLFYSPNQNLLVLGIAGTDPISAYDWMTEDAKVTKTVKWSDIVGTEVKLPWLDGNAAISEGTNIGLNALLAMTATTTTGADSSTGETTLLAALTSFTKTAPANTTLAVAGHSLGGALSPVMALYLHDMQEVAGSNWNSGGKVTQIIAMPTAGPTPGEKNFVAYYEHVVKHPKAGIAPLSYTSKYNVIDVVPHAWEAATLDKIPSLYESHIIQPKGASPMETIMGSVVVGLHVNAFNEKHAVTGIPFDSYKQFETWTKLNGTFNTDIDSAIQKKLKYISVPLTGSGLVPYTPYFTNFVRFLAQMIYQHTTAYNDLLNITDFMTEYRTHKASITGVTEEEAQAAALHKAAGVNFSEFDPTVIAESVTQQ